MSEGWQRDLEADATAVGGFKDDTTREPDNASGVESPPADLETAEDPVNGFEFGNEDSRLDEDRLGSRPGEVSTADLEADLEAEGQSRWRREGSDTKLTRLVWKAI